MPRLDERPGGVVDQHGLGWEVRKGGEPGLDRIRPLGPAEDDLDARQSRQGFGGGRFLSLGHDDDQPFGSGRRQAFGRPAEHGLAGEQAPLFRAVSACTAAHPCGGDDG